MILTRLVVFLLVRLLATELAGPTNEGKVYITSSDGLPLTN